MKGFVIITAKKIAGVVESGRHNKVLYFAVMFTATLPVLFLYFFGGFAGLAAFILIAKGKELIDSVYPDNHSCWYYIVDTLGYIIISLILLLWAI